MARSLRFKIKAYLPDWAIFQGCKNLNMVHIVRHFGGRHPRECPICGYKGLFAYKGVNPVVPDSLCPRCRSIGRHRQHHLLMLAHPEWLDGKDVLHIAPELCFVADYKARAHLHHR